MSVRRLAQQQPASFAFAPATLKKARAHMANFPAGRQQSAVIGVLWLVQKQDGWISEPAIRAVAELLGMPAIRVLEVATFYTMFNLAPVGRHLVQVCTTTPCWLAGSDAVVGTCKRHISPRPQTVSADGVFSWMEVECLGACVNAPVIQIGKDYYEDLNGKSAEAILLALRRGEQPKAGSQTLGRQSSEPVGGTTTLTDRSLYEPRKPPRAAT